MNPGAVSTSAAKRWFRLGLCRSAACLACNSLGNTACGATTKPSRNPGASTLDRDPM